MRTSKELRDFQRTLLSRPTSTEALFARRLRAAGIPFMEQTILGFYIADILIGCKLLVIELDGAHHGGPYDDRRDWFLQEAGFSVLRIQNRAAASFDLGTLSRYPDVPLKALRSALGKANALKGRIILEVRKKRGVESHVQKDKRSRRRFVYARTSLDDYVRVAYGASK